MYIEETGVHCAMCACMAALYSAPQNFASQKTNENVKPEAKTATMGKKQNLVISDKKYIKSYNFFRFEKFVTFFICNVFTFITFLHM